MRIDKIKINNFKSIYNNFELDFTNLKGFWKISGPVGSGKTTIGEAIIFGLFGTVNGKNNSDLISWGQKHGLVELWCTSNNKNIYIKRELNLYGQSPVYIEIDGEELMFSNKRDAQDKLENEYYDTSKMILELLCIISFNNFKSLASLNTSDTKKFLDQILGFYILTEYSDVCKELKNDNYDAMRRCQNDINSKQSQVDKLIELSSMAKIEGDINQTKSKILELKNEKNDIIKEYQIKINDYNSIIRDLNDKISSTTALGKSKSKEIEFIQKGICPTCGANIDRSHLEEKKKEREILLNYYNDLSKSLEKETKEINNLNIEYNNKLKDYDGIIFEHSTLLSKLEEQSKRSNITQNEIDNIKNEIKNLNKQLDKYKNEDNQWSELYNILSSEARSKILSSFIPILNENIQKYAALLQLPYIINFDNNFKCNIEIYGVENKIPISSLSTGQLKVVDMVIILGFLGTILGNNGINIIFLDELFSNLDEEMRENMCQLLKQTMTDNKTIFIISHQDINSQIFNGEINLKLESNNIYNKSQINIKKYEI